jgi:hypothetical protein
MSDIGFRVAIYGVNGTAAAFKADAKAIESETGRAVAKAGEFVIGDSRLQFEGERTHALYEISGGRVTRRRNPSTVTSPANKLGVFEGTYRKAISQEIAHSGSLWSTEVGPVGIPYAAAHEFGTARLPRRPVLGPGVDAALPKIDRVLGAVVRVIKQ